MDRSKIFAATFDKTLAAYDAATALILPGHLFDYNLAASDSWLCACKRFFWVAPKTILFTIYPYYGNLN